MRKRELPPPLPAVDFRTLTHVHPTQTTPIPIRQFFEDVTTIGTYGGPQVQGREQVGARFRVPRWPLCLLFIGRICSDRDLIAARTIAVAVSLHKRSGQDARQGIRQANDFWLFVFHVNHLLPCWFPSAEGIRRTARRVNLGAQISQKARRDVTRGPK